MSEEKLETSEQASPNSNFLFLGFGAVAILILAVVVMVLITTGDISETPAPASLSVEASAGKALYLASNCSNCHPSEGRAGGTGPRLSTIGLGDTAVRNIIRRGKGVMPANSKLSDDEVNKILIYIRAIKPTTDLGK